MPLRHLAEVRVSNVDKKSVDAEIPVRLCNYTDVYYQDVIDPETDFMAATATREQIRAFSLRAGDILFTKDSETPDDIAVPAFVAADLPGVVSGYHLALVRADANRIDPKFLFRVMQSDYMREQFAVAASGVTRYGLTYGAIRGAGVPRAVTNVDEQRRISDFLDDQVSRFDEAVALRTAQLGVLLERTRSSYDRIFDGPERPLKSLLSQDPCYGVLVPRFVGSGGVPFIRVGDLSRPDLGSDVLVKIEAAQSREYRRTVTRAGDVLLSVVGSIDKALVVTSDLAGCNVARAVARLVPGAVPPTVLIGWARTSRYAYFAKMATASDTAQPTLNMGDLKNFGVALPAGTRLDVVADMVSRVESTHASLTFQLKSSMRLLQERKRALITAAVTGEFDVRTASGRGVA